MTKRLFFAGLSCLLLLNSCLSLKIVLRLPQKSGEHGTLELEYRLSEDLQNISNYPYPRDDIAPMPLPLWEWDFRSIAAQSETIELLNYSFRQAHKKGDAGLVRATLRFAGEDDLRLLLGREIQWRDRQFRWQLSSNDVENPDASYPQLDGDLSAEEHLLLQQVFAGQTLDILVTGGSSTSTAYQQLTMADFITGKESIDISQ
ncbi:hypothetical protein P0082_06525 [Candidatus Haliotispira prima]|uniref:Lipoprotein n=1 Tax=Candidatus Haliotispira prima TaxID=3034016 RepID=A0ABY8MDT8_9SPIO|nr:hypothetical protein P0082_06525 [Candidatus Haliotispira prima]